MRTATVTIDAEHVSPSRSLAILARSSRALVCVTGRMFAELERELGGPEAVARHLFRVATDVGTPIRGDRPTPTAAGTG